MVFTFLAASALISGCAVRAREDVYGQPFLRPMSSAGASTWGRLSPSSSSCWRRRYGTPASIRRFRACCCRWFWCRCSRTYPAELIYRLQVWIFDWGWPGRLLAIILSFTGGLYGTSSIFTYLLGGFVFSDTCYLLYWSVPGVIAGYIVAISFVINWRLCENRHIKDSVTVAIKHDN